MYRQIAKNKRNTIILMMVFVVMLVFIGAIVGYVFEDWQMFIWFFFGSLIYVVIQYFLANRFLIKMSGAEETTRKENPRLYNIVENLAIEENLPLPKIYIIDDPAPNAFASGRDPEHAIVAATTGLLDVMSDNELRAVMAHEMSHIKNYDIRVSMIVFGLVSLIGLLTDTGVRMIWRSDKDDVKSPVGLLLAMFTMMFMPLIATLTRLSISRQREYLADMSAAKMLGGAEDMISALKKLQTHGMQMKRRNSAVAQMYINNPMKGLFGSAFSTHPSLERRIEELEKSKHMF